MMLAPIISVVSDKGGNPICDIVDLLNDMLISHCDRKAEKGLDIAEDWMGVWMLCPILDPANNSSRIIMNNNPSRSEILPRIDNTYLSSTKLHFWSRWLKQMRAPYSKSLAFGPCMIKPAPPMPSLILPSKLTFRPKR